MTPSANQNIFFDFEKNKKNLKSRSTRGGVITIVSQAIKFLLKIGSMVALARLLTPNDFGLIAMVTAITAFVSSFKDLGLSVATIQKEKITHKQISTLFWVNVLLGIGMMAIVATISPVVACFYNDPRLIPVTLALSITFVFSGLSVQHQALLKRNMHFSKLAIVEIVAAVFGTAIAIVSAFYGLGYWSLVFMHMTIPIATAVGVWASCRWIPGRPFRDTGVRAMLSFGGDLVGFNIINYLARNLDNILIGRFCGASQLAFYAQAYNLLTLPLKQINAPIAAVAIPTLSRLQDDPDRYRRYYLKALSIINLLIFPFVAFLIMMSEEIIFIILGPQWGPSSQIYMILGFAAFTQPIANTTGWLFITQGRTRHMLQWGLIGGMMTIFSLLAGLPWGPTGIAFAYTTSGLLIRNPVLFWFACKKGPIHYNDLYRSLILPGLIAICIMISLLIFRLLTPAYDEIGMVFGGLAVSFLVTAIVLIVCPEGRQQTTDLKELVLAIRSRKS